MERDVALARVLDGHFHKHMKGVVGARPASPPRTAAAEGQTLDAVCAPDVGRVLSPLLSRGAGHCRRRSGEALPVGRHEAAVSWWWLPRRRAGVAARTP
jgi:hypothetical protein